MSIEENITFHEGRTEIYGQAQLFHCNHYNRSIQQYIEDPGYVDSEQILLQSAAETGYRQAQGYLEREGEDFDDLLDWGEEIFAFGGFGNLDTSPVEPSCGTAVEYASHYGSALQTNVGERDQPGEYFDRGFTAGLILAGAEEFDIPLGTAFDLVQSRSISLGDDECRFVVDPAGDNNWLAYTDPDPYDPVDPAPITTNSNIDESEVIEAVQGLGLSGNEDGLIPQFGVQLTNGYAEYYNKGCFRTADQIVEEMGDISVAEEMFVEAGHICGFNTMGGIMTSPEWDAVVKPMIETQEDWIHGIVAVINALGWGTWRVEELEPDESLTIRVYNPYESVGYERWFGTPDYMADFTATGVAAALMNLVYEGDIMESPALTDEYYFELFQSKEDSFEGEQTVCAAQGEDFSEIQVSR